MLEYKLGKNEKENWLIAETSFCEKQLGKCESIFYLGNGYMGVRSSTEEPYLGETRGMFVAGNFNKFDETEVTELPNMPDITRMDIVVDGETLDLSKIKYREYIRILDLKEGELRREFSIITAQEKQVRFQFARIVSLKNHHIIGQSMKITADHKVTISIKSGINGTVTNSGYQHLSVKYKRFYEEKILQANYQTTQSKIGVSINTAHRVFIDGREKEQIRGRIEMDSRSIYMNYEISLEENQDMEIQKISGVYTQRDMELENMDWGQYAHENLMEELGKGYGLIRKEHVAEWEKIWERQDIQIDSKNSLDQLGIRFAMFHMVMMTPGHDSRMNIAAKALSGEGYKGHTFWDTEMFLLPFWVYTNPDTARNLLEYRYLGLEGARKKAKDNGYQGAMYPWESAWITDGEVTPKLGAADVVTGKEMPIICGDLEQHITSDVAYGVWEYYQITGDEKFMETYGYQIIFETAIFWASRIEWKEENQRYEIWDVIGPDEYSEHVNNNAFTNYMAQWNIQVAVLYYEKLEERKEEWFQKLKKTLNLPEQYQDWLQKAEKIYVPTPDESLLVPQDDNYLTYPVINLKKYKESATRADIIKDYNMEQMAHIQVSKQADVLVLFYIMENLFQPEVKQANFYYYEDKCLHDSSLSLSTHAIIASDLKEKAMSYDFFQRALTIDLGPDMNTPKDGIHAASMGGIWQCVINGFAGVRMINGRLRVSPNLPEAWNSIRFKLNWKGAELQFDIGKDSMEVVSNDYEKDTSFTCYDKIYQISEKISIKYL